jgi:hypothetical protein
MRDFINIIEGSVSHGFYDPSATWLHGGPFTLEGDALKRYGRKGGDAGALFFCKESLVGTWYCATYARPMFGSPGKVYKVKLSAPVDSILDLTNPASLSKLKKGLSKDEFNYIMESRGDSGHMDWNTVDEEQLEPLGFKGCVFQERPKGMKTGLPSFSGLETLPEPILSIGIFNAADAHIIGSFDPQEFWDSLGAS